MIDYVRRLREIRTRYLCRMYTVKDAAIHQSKTDGFLIVIYKPARPQGRVDAAV